jgi:hypothetical protein
MTVVSSKEFVSHQKRYFDLAKNERVAIKRGGSMFHLIYVPVENSSDYDEISAPDDDFRSAISADEFREKLIVVLERVDKKYASKCK